ncbi:hypothetical protein ABT282_30960 [Streptomyces sp. NPDC000927]|uniref:hypothetical protein n=1 Tax=Streptomyces sp. NPDC000927 TaxID=3154371 RepID=UPI00332131E1
MAAATLATTRLNRLITTDVITAPIRMWLDACTSRTGRFASAVTSCVWCTGIYTATATTAYAHWVTGLAWTALPLTALSVAWIAPVISSWLEG